MFIHNCKTYQVDADHGVEHFNQDLINSCDFLGITLHYSSLGNINAKPFCERFFIMKSTGYSHMPPRQQLALLALAQNAHRK